MSDYLSTGDVAKILASDTRYVVREVKRGRLPCQRQIPRIRGTSYRFTRAEVVAYCEVFDRVRLAYVPRETFTPLAPLTQPPL